ncbi:MAG TPA: gliding motility-associated C-terminal domain-containing protein [Lentimicrobium sp.]|nr:gliding motility-associated C-terminal domain-containing protein [Lentimicrobium sp.]
MKAVKAYDYTLLKLVFLILAQTCLLTLPAKATHQRAGEITYRHLNNLTYEVTITTWTYAPSTADRCELTINWGDGKDDILQRVNGDSGSTPAGVPCNHIGEIVGREIRKNVYKGVHTYPSASTYRIWLEDPNRNMGIQNIPNSVDVPLYIETLLVINPFLGSNDSPQLLIPPIDNGCIDRQFVHNPGAYDPNGDSLSYKLVTPRGAGGLNILGYQLPNMVDEQNPGLFTINPVTGDILWDSPTIQGEYNFAMIIEEWRNGVRIGYVTRDMQVNIIACENEPPELSLVRDTCVIAGDTLNVNITATDPDYDKLTITASGGPLLLPVNNAQFNITYDSAGIMRANVEWPTTCNNVRLQPYQIYFKVEDDGAPVNLIDLETMNIRVIAPPVTGVSAAPLGNSITLSWQRANCSEARGYRIYRRAGNSSFTPGPCVTGVPPSSGFRLVATLDGINTTSYIDDNNSVGLVRGITYCYIVTYWFSDNAESIASEEFCTDLKKDLPVLTNVSIDSTSATNGQIYVAWSKPTELDSTQTPGPFIYRLYRSDGFSSTNEVLVTELNDLNDTIYVDRGMNTLENSWTYRVELINNTPGNVFSVGYSVPATSIFLQTSPSDRQITLIINENVPWANEQYIIYRKVTGSSVFDSLTMIQVRRYVDTGLVNEQQYCYYIRTVGTYGTPGYIEPIINYSQIKCESPIDNVAPCLPMLTADINCEDLQITFAWENIALTCAPDIESYLLYRKGNPTELIATISPENTSYVYNIPSQIISACYFVAAVDTNGNLDTTGALAYCLGIDDCPRYRLPNVFTPNGDQINDYFVPFPGYTSVERVEMQIVNRWGVVVFETVDPEIKWDGKDKNTNKLCPEGVYFYRCVVYEVVSSAETPELTSVQKRLLTNSVHLLY